MKRNIKKVLIDLSILLLLSIALFSAFIMYKDLEIIRASSSVLEDDAYFQAKNLDEENGEGDFVITDEDLAYYRSINDDFTGYLYISDSEISFPVVKGDNNSFYLWRSFEKKRNYVGCPFVDYRSVVTDRNKVIHGHNMGYQQTAMFSTLVNYQDKSYFEQHPDIYYAEIGAEGQKYRIFSVLNFDTRKLNVFDYMQRKFASDEEFLEWINYLQTHSMFQTDVVFDENSQVIILSTCNDAYGTHNRLLIAAVK